MQAESRIRPEHMNEIIDKYGNLLKAQTALFGRFNTVLTGLRTAVKKKDWPALEEIIGQLNSIGEKIAEIEQNRNDAWFAIKRLTGLSPDAPFNTVAARLPGEYGSSITALTAGLKVAVFQVHETIRGLGYYLSSLAGLIQGIVEEVFPHTRGKLYSRNGRAQQNSENPVMVNREL